MTAFALSCGVHDTARAQAVERTLQIVQASGLELVRIGWCDLHGVVRGKTLVASALKRAFDDGLGMVSTLMLKDTSDRTAFKVFEPGGTDSLPGFGQANNFLLLPDPESFQQLPWAESTGWLRAQPWFPDGRPVELDTRRVLQCALKRLAEAGLRMQCGLEVEFHIYKCEDTDAQLNPDLAAWPGDAPRVSMIHPGYNLLTESWFDMAEPALRIVQRTAQALGLPLLSLEVEMGPSQVEAVFDVTDALTAADNMVLFRNAVKQALRRAGYHATFMCRPPFPNIMSSGWHLHQSLIDQNTGHNAFQRATPLPGSTLLDAGHSLSDLGEHYLAGLLDHARGMTVFCTPTSNGFGRYRPNALAPQSVLWGRDNRGAMLRVIGECGDKSTRIENRLGESAANPYLYMASQIHAGLDGIRRQLRAPPATTDPYNSAAQKLPCSLDEALDALQQDAALTSAIGADFVAYYTQIKGAEALRFEQAEDKNQFHRREYFGRI
jgi:glutamine synthetase